MTDHIGDVNEMVPMTQQRLDQIKRLCAEDICTTDVLDLIAEVERLRAEVERFRAKRNETIDAIENLMESCRACDMCALNESDDTCSDNGEGYCSPVWIGRKEG